MGEERKGRRQTGKGRGGSRQGDGKGWLIVSFVHFLSFSVIVTVVKTLAGDEMTTMIVEMITEERTGEKHHSS